MVSWPDPPGIGEPAGGEIAVGELGAVAVGGETVFVVAEDETVAFGGETVSVVFAKGPRPDFGLALHGRACRSFRDARERVTHALRAGFCVPFFA